MYYRKENKTNVQISQEIIRDFKGYVKNVVYKSTEYQNIMMRKALYSIKGHKSHPLFFDIMIKDGKYFYIGDYRGNIPLNIPVDCVKM